MKCIAKLLPLTDGCHVCNVET